MKEYAVWNKGDTYLVRARTPVHAIQQAISLHYYFVPSYEWNVQALDEYSYSVQQKIRRTAMGAITV
jgi:hypothetical protein